MRNEGSSTDPIGEVLGKTMSETTGNLSPENEYDGHEYKRHFNFNYEEISVKGIQMIRRITQGGGRAIYSLGMDDDGTPYPLNEKEFTSSVTNLQTCAKQINACMIPGPLQKVVIDGEDHYHGDFYFEFIPGRIQYMDVRVVVAGNADAGKSTTIGVLISGKSDNGSGSARVNVLTHRHEFENKGRTSDISYRMMGFDSKGDYINGRYRRYDAKNIASNSSKVVTFVDLAGQREFITTTAAAMTSSLPDYGMLMVNSSSGIDIKDTTKDHIELFNSYNIPFITVFTMSDITTKQRGKETFQKLRSILKNFGYALQSIMKEEDLAHINLHSSIVPAFKISNVTGEGLDLLKKFYSQVVKREQSRYHISIPSSISSKSSDWACVPISNIYMVTGVGMVLSGIVDSGMVQVGQSIYVGPNSLGEYHPLIIKTIEINYTRIKEAVPGDHIAMAFKKFPDTLIPRKGMVLIGSAIPRLSVQHLTIKIKMTQTSNSCLRVGSCPHGFVGCARVTFTILEIDKGESVESSTEDVGTLLRQGDEAILKCKLSQFVFTMPGVSVLFQDSNMRGDGVVIGV